MTSEEFKSLLLNPGQPFKAPVIAWDSKEVKQLIEDTKKAQRKVLALKEIDWGKISRTYITI